MNICHDPNIIKLVFLTGSMFGSAKWLSIRNFQLIQVILHFYSLVSFLSRFLILCSWMVKKNLAWFAEERVDLSKYPPVCLPSNGDNFAVNTTAFVFGRWSILDSKWEFKSSCNMGNIYFVNYKAGERLIMRTQQTSFKKQRCVHATKKRHIWP